MFKYTQLNIDKLYKERDETLNKNIISICKCTFMFPNLTDSRLEYRTAGLSKVLHIMRTFE